MRPSPSMPEKIKTGFCPDFERDGTFSIIPKEKD